MSLNYKYRLILYPYLLIYLFIFYLLIYFVSLPSTKHLLHFILSLSSVHLSMLFTSTLSHFELLFGPTEEMLLTRCLSPVRWPEAVFSVFYVEWVLLKVQIPLCISPAHVLTHAKRLSFYHVCFCAMKGKVAAYLWYMRFQIPDTHTHNQRRIETILRFDYSETHR